MIPTMFERKRSGSVVCPSCGSLVGVRDERCYSCGRANPGLWGFAPALRRLGADLGFVPLVIGGSTVLYVLTLLASGSQMQLFGGDIFSILSPSITALFLFGASGAVPVFEAGRWWTVLSATWLHGSLLHILFNMLWVREIGPLSVDVVGPGRTVIIYVISGVVGFIASSFAGAYLGFIPIRILQGAGITVGASASIFGLLGALVHYGRVSGSSLIRGHAGQYALLLFVFGLLMPGIDNYAHAGGFLGGYAVSALMNPLQRESGDHVLIALICLALTLLAVVFSVLNGLQFLG
jgi:membrane associated rhomboid family serine protease